MCPLETATVQYLLDTQGRALTHLALNRTSENARQLKTSHATALADMSFRSIEERPRKLWPYHLLAGNLHHLQHLELGIEERKFQDYHNDNPQTQHELSETIYQRLRKSISSEDDEVACAMPLTSLGLCGLNFLSLITGRELFDFNRLPSLKLESCTHLSEVFEFLKNPAAHPGPILDLKSIRKFSLRQENVTNKFSVDLADFIMTLTDLESLEVLLEGVTKSLKLLSILEKHGKTLNTFVWDERMERRTQVEKSPSLTKILMENLECVCNHCPNLKALGIGMHWKSLVSQKAESSVAVRRILFHLTLPDYANIM